MKREYKKPASRWVNVDTESLIAESIRTFMEDGAPEIENSDAILTKEIKNTNLWDTEW